MGATAKVLNSRREVVIDGGGLVTLSGAGRRRILYMDTCDPAQEFTTSHCQDQATPRLVVENLGLRRRELDRRGLRRRRRRRDLRARRAPAHRRLDASSATAASRTGPDLGGGAVRVLSQYHGLPVEVVGSRFTANVCSNGGALSSIGVSWNVTRSRVRRQPSDRARREPVSTRHAGRRQRRRDLQRRQPLHAHDHRAATCPATTQPRAAGRSSSSATTAPARSRSSDSVLDHNPSDGFQTAGLPGIFFLGAGPPAIVDSVLR